jgi:multidrug resistance efflux pump
VRAGQVLARLDDRLARARVAAAEAGLAQAKARYLLARRGPRSEDVTAARAEADAAAAAARHRGAEQARSEQLGRVGALATTVVDADDAAARVATAQAAAATARYQSLARGTRSEQIEEAAAAIALAQAELDAARVALDQTALVAPSDGVILRRTGEVGALVTLTTPAPVVSMANLSELELRAEVDEADIAAIAVGQAAYVTADAYGDRRFPVVIRRVTRELGRKTVRDDDPRARVDTRVLEVIARFDGPPGVALPLGLRMQLHAGRPLITSR